MNLTIDEWSAFFSRRETRNISLQNARTQTTILLDKLSIDELETLINDYEESLQ